jgi:hypothetical protein
MAPDEWTATEVEDLKAAINDGLSERRKRPMEFSTPPFCQGLWGSQKKIIRGSGLSA